MYWLLVSSLFWAHTFGNYDSIDDCKAAAKDAPWYTSATCVPFPEENHKH